MLCGLELAAMSETESKANANPVCRSSSSNVLTEQIKDGFDKASVRRVGTGVVV